MGDKNQPIEESLEMPEELFEKMWPSEGLVKLADRHGNTFHVGNAGGFWHPPFPLGPDTDYRTHIRNITNLEIRDDDILMCSFPKTGLNWNTEIITRLMRKDPAPCKEGFLAGFLDAVPSHMVDAMPSPRLLITHVPFRYIPKQALEKKIKIIQLDRNPKDVLVSYYHFIHGHKIPLHYPGTFEHFFDLYLEVGLFYGDVFDYALEFQTGREENPDVPFFMSVFEEMKLDPLTNVKRLNDFLGTGCSDELCEQIVEACGFKPLKEFRDANLPPVSALLFRKETKGFYRKGIIGDWKNWFTVAMNERFDKVFEKRMANYKTKYIFSQ